MLRFDGCVLRRFAAVALASGLVYTAASFSGFSQGVSSNGSVAVTTPSKDIHEEGIPVTDPLVLSKCGGCHQKDAKGNLTRISWIRTTPEGWEEAMKRMVRLHGLELQPEEARSILRYLSDEHGLAPAEAQPVAYMAEERMIDEKVPSDDIAHACKSCHALGKPLSWHRSADDWKLLVNMHIAYFPNAEMNAFARMPHRPGAAAAVPEPPPVADKRAPSDLAIEYLVKTEPLHSPQWSDWRASMRNPRLNGRWLVSGSQPGKGPFYGEMTIETGKAPESVSSTSKVTFVRDGTVLTQTGTAFVYTGYAWRGRTKVQSPGSSPDSPQTIRQVMMLSRDQSQMEGRWFWGSYNEFGMDVKMRRATDGITVLGTDVASLKAGSAGNEIHIFGDHLPQDLTAADIDLGSGVTVKKISSKHSGTVTALVDVAADATPGRRDIEVRHIVAPDALAIYNQIDFIKVTPETALAHLGSEPHAKGYWQFEAVAYSNGPDGKPNTPDDINLGPVPAQWKLEEFVASYGDDDTDFVGSLNADTGLFIPASDGPNPKRRQSRNNYGDVWVTATVKPFGSGAALNARSYLIVAVPQYVHWDQPEVAATGR